MNIRIDQKSVRIRISQKEAEMLYLNNVLTESLPFPNGLFEFTILCSTFASDLAINENFQLTVPSQLLKNLLESKSNESKPSFFTIENSIPFELAFEIDKFTRNKDKIF